MSSSDDAFTLGRRVVTPLPAVFDDAVSGLTAGGALSRLRVLTVEQNRLEAERSAVLTRLYELRDDARRVREESSRRFVDEWDELVAEVGAALGVGRAASGSAVHRGLDLRERCPRLFALFATGAVGLSVVREVLRASAAVLDEDLAREFDEQVTAWLTNRTGQSVTVGAVADAAKTILTRIDPAAARETPQAAPRERLEFHARTDGLVDLEAVMPKDQALRLSAQINPVARSVCRDDGRTLGQRQVAALVALAEGYESLGCLCGKDSCELREPKPRGGAVSQEIQALAMIVLNESDLADIHPGGATATAETDTTPPDPDLFTENAFEYDSPGDAADCADASDTSTDVDEVDEVAVGDADVDGSLAGTASGSAASSADIDASDVDDDGAAAPDVPGADAGAADPDDPCDANDADDTDRAGREPRGRPGRSSGAVILTGEPGITGPVTVGQAGELIANARTQWRVLGRRDPGTGAIHVRGAGGYRPTGYQLLVMRLTYPTCVFPGCSVPSDRCQADHVDEYDRDDPTVGGATTVAGCAGPGNLVPLCGFHHRIKTETGWLSDVLADGTVEWRHPTGGIYTVPPGTARELLPGLGKIIWDAPDPTPTTPKSPDGLQTAAKRKAKARRALRAKNRLLRQQRRERRAAEAQARQRAEERAAAEAAGRTYDETAPLKPPPF